MTELCRIVILATPSITDSQTAQTLEILVLHLQSELHKLSLGKQQPLAFAILDCTSWRQNELLSFFVNQQSPGRVTQNYSEYPSIQSYNT